MTNVKWADSIWFFDLDDTLITTAEASESGIEGVESYIRNGLDSGKAAEFKNRLTDLYHLMLAGYKVRDQNGWAQVPGGESAYKQLVQRIESCQPEVIAKHGHAKKWSREIWIKLVADDLLLPITSEQVHQAAEAYWNALTDNAVLFDGAKVLLSEIRNHGRKVYIVTSSDGRLKMQPDGIFVYDPAYSEMLKRHRVERMKEKGLLYDGLSIGDPEDKPHPEFFQKGLVIAEKDAGAEIDLRQCVMVGDSYGGDLQTPHEKMGFGLVVWFNKHQTGIKEEEPGYFSTGDLSFLPTVIQP
jgi:FMN phosphatase YigB (HAD superfamily)